MSYDPSDKFFKYLDPQHKDKRNHFVSKNTLVCESHLLAPIKQANPYVGDSYDPNTYWLDPVNFPLANTTKDPLREKTGRYWRMNVPFGVIHKFETDGVVSYGPKDGSTYSTGFYNSNIQGFHEKLRQPYVLTDEGLPISYQNEFVMNPDRYKHYTDTNPYKHRIVQGIDLYSYVNLEVPSSIFNSEGYGRAITAFLINLFMKNSLCLTYRGGEIDLNQYLPPSTPKNVPPLKVNEDGTVPANQDAKSLRMALGLITTGLFFPFATKKDEVYSFDPLSFTFIDRNPSLKAFAGKGTEFTTVDKIQMEAYGAFTDSAFELLSFVSTQAIEHVDSLKDVGNFSGIHFADIDPVYNFLSTKYEQDLGTQDIAHTKLPNIYNEVSILTTAEEDDNSSALTSKSQLEYFANYFSKVVVGSSFNFGESNKKYSHIFVDNQGIYNYSNIQQYKENFPMSVDISFRSHTSNQKIMNALKSSGASKNLLKSLIYYCYGADMSNGSRAIYPVAPDQPMFFPYYADDTNRFYENVGNNQNWSGVERIAIATQEHYNNSAPIKYTKTGPSTDPHIFSNNLLTFNFDKWIDNQNMPQGFESVVSENLTFYTDSASQDEKLSKNPLVLLFSSLVEKTELKSTITKVIEEVSRDYQDVMNGKLAYNEVLFYKIEKSLNGTVLQNFWLENTPTIDTLRYIDTQVKYGVDYDYKIYAYTAVVGTKYNYSVGQYTPFGETKIPHLDDFDFENNQPKYISFIQGSLPSINYQKYSDDSANALYAFGQTIANYDQYSYFGQGKKNALGWKEAERLRLTSYRDKYPQLLQPVLSKYVELLAQNKQVEEQLSLAEEILQQEQGEYEEAFDMISNDQNPQSIVSLKNKAMTFIVGQTDQGPQPTWAVFQKTTSSPGTGYLDDENSNKFNQFFSVVRLGSPLIAEKASAIGSSYYSPSQPYAGYDYKYELAYSTLELNDFLFEYYTDSQNYSTVSKLNAMLNNTSNLSKLKTKMHIQMQQIKAIIDIKNNTLEADAKGLLDGLEDATPTGYTLEDVLAEVTTQYSLLDQFYHRIQNVKDKMIQVVQLFDVSDSSVAALQAYQDQQGSEYTQALGEEATLQDIEDNKQYVDSDGTDYTDLFENLHNIIKNELQAETLLADLDTSDSYDRTTFNVISEPFVKIVEVPVYQEIASVIDDPSLPPQIYFNHFKEKENYLLISFDNTVGEEQAVPLLFTGDNFEMMDKVRRKQDCDYTNGDIQGISALPPLDFVKPKITFKTDDYANYFQVFRKPVKPRNAEDFDGNDFLDNVQSLDGSYLDIIPPNQKFYYMFRTIDKHGHPSNPTPVYEVELVSDEGALYLLIDVVDFSEQETNMKAFESFQRYLQIDPGFVQTLIDEDKTDFKEFASANEVELKLGIAEESIYNDKKFKLRITSKTTGKKLDINLNFKKTVNPDQTTPNIIL